jgi:pimeloyl-ACP methyl ester carboxylesterase
MHHELDADIVARVIDPPEAQGTILYVHGLGESGLSLQGVATHPRLAAWRHLIPDMPGYGKSPWAQHPLDLAEQADALAAWLRRRGAGPVAVLGHSMGGVIALLLAERNPEVVAALVDVEGNKSLEDCHFSSQALAHSREEFVERGMGALLDRVYEGGLSERALRFYFASMCQADPRAFHANGDELVSLSRGERLAARLAALACPKLTITGSPGGAGARSLKLARDAGLRVETLEPAGHWPFIDQKERFVEHLDGFLRTGLGKGGG